MKSIEYIKMDKIATNKIDVEYCLRADVRVKVDRLKESIESLGGLVQLPVVFKKNDRYGLIVGCRRLEAYKELGKDMPVLIIEQIDRETAALASIIENLQRVDPSVEDIRVACGDLVEKYLKEGVGREELVEDIQKRLGTTEGTAQEYLSLILLPDEIMEMVAKGDLTKRDAEVVFTSAYPNEKRMLQIANMIKEGKLKKAQQAVLKQVLSEIPEDAPIDDLPERTRSIALERWVILLPPIEADRIKKASERLKIAPDALIRVATLDWLERKGY